MRLRIWLTAFFCFSATAETLSFHQVQADVIHKRFQNLEKDNQQRGLAIHRMFEEVGCTGDALIQEKPKGPKSNIVCTLPGESDETVIVGAHFDHVAAGEGAVDNWSGASLLPALYETMKAAPKRRFTWVFIAFAEEEKGLLGSKAFVRGLPKEAPARVHAMINLDCVGLTSPKVWISRSDKRLVNLIAIVAHAIGQTLGAVNVEQVGDSDSHAFRDKDIPVLDIHSITQQTLPILHSGKDVRSAVDPGAYYETYRLLAATLTWMDGHFDRYQSAAQSANN